MKISVITKILLVFLSLLICVGMLSSCMKDVAEEDKDAVKSAVKRKVSLRSEEEIAQTGLTAEDVLAALDDFLLAVEKKHGGDEEVRFLSVAGERVDFSLDEFGGAADYHFLEYFSPYRSNMVYVYGARVYAVFDYDVSYYTITVRETRKSIVGTRTAALDLSIPLEILEPVLSAFGDEKIEYRMATDLQDMKSDFDKGLWSAGISFGDLYQGDYYWRCSEIGESVIREASPEQLDVLYTFCKELYKIVIDEDFSAFSEFDSDYYGLASGEALLVSFQELQELNSKGTCTGLILDENGRPIELCFNGSTHGKYIYSYEENGDLKGITEMLYSDHGVLESTNELSLEKASQIVFYDLPYNVLPKDGYSSREAVVNIIPEKIGYQSIDNSNFYELDKKHPDDCVLAYGFHVVIILNGEQCNEGYINLRTMEWPYTHYGKE